MKTLQMLTVILSASSMLVVVYIYNLLRKEERLMIALFTTLIIKGRFKFENVPPKLKPYVAAMLRDAGFDEDGNPIDVPGGNATEGGAE